MNLADIIAGRGVASAIPAIVAIPPPPAPTALAEIAEIALATAPTDPTYRRWLVRDPSGKCWDVTRTPSVSHAELAAFWPPGSVLEPLADAPPQPTCTALPAAVEAKIRRWLGHIDEMDTAIIGEVLSRCRHEPGVLAFYLDQDQNMPGGNPGTPTTCGTCAHYRRTSHPRLGHCQAGEPEPAGGLWDTTPRSCQAWKAS